MAKELLLRFLVGGIFVSIFALLSDLFRPRRFAGLFGAAPSVALTTLALTIAEHGKQYAATEARSMIAGALAFAVYTFAVCQLLVRWKSSALVTTMGMLALWFLVALGLWRVWLR
jgi:Protein of unknown function (DUF3147)